METVCLGTEKFGCLHASMSMSMSACPCLTWSYGDLLELQARAYVTDEFKKPQEVTDTSGISNAEVSQTASQVPTHPACIRLLLLHQNIKVAFFLPMTEE